MNEPKKATRSQKKGAKEILRLGEKALSYRKDLLAPDKATDLETAVIELKIALKGKPLLIDDLEKKAENLDIQLKESGGLYYHKKGWVENVEMLMVAAIVVIGIRSFFLQPFIIPNIKIVNKFIILQHLNFHFNKH